MRPGLSRIVRAAVALLVLSLATSGRAHDIPNAQVDRSIQVTVRPGRLAVDYEVSLAELTLTQDLRALTGGLPGSDRQTWFDEYGRVVGPLNAKGLLVRVDGRPRDLRPRGFDLVVEEHPRYTFYFEAELPERGKLTVQDTNYIASEGTSRLALRGAGGVMLEGDDLPQDVAQIPTRPVWQLSDAEERRTRQAEVRFDRARMVAAPSRGPAQPAAAPASSIASNPSRPPAPRPTGSGGRNGSAGRLARLLDRAAAASGLGLALVALGLGAAHAVQPGHGKTLVAAATVGDRGGWPLGVLLALTITIAHMGGVLAVALMLGLTHASRYEAINQGLTQAAGFLIAAIGFWRLGRHLAGFGEHDAGATDGLDTDLGTRGLLGLGLAGGLVPCWDAIVLIVLAEAIGRLALGLVLLAAFSLGMAGVLVAVGLLAARLRQVALRADREGRWEHRLGGASALALTAIGLYLWSR